MCRRYHSGNKNSGNQVETDEENSDDDIHTGSKDDCHYIFLRKIIKHAKSFDPELSEEAEAMIAKCWTGLSSSVFATAENGFQ
jgi:DNA replicative helicase MCM subunit Mcm2 (Cdc46/Mcm family)